MKPDKKKPYAPGGAGRTSNRHSESNGSDRRGSAAPRNDRYVPSRSAKRLLQDVMDVSHAPVRSERPTRRGGFEPQDHEHEGLDRLHKYLARCGVASRRAAEAIIAEGRVEVNGEIVREMGIKVYPGRDRILVDGVPCQPEKLHYVLLYKPKGVLTTLSDPRRRPTIVKYLPDLGVMLRPVGRLDMDSEGLLICTNDGNLADRLTHPKFGVEKEYEVIVKGDVDDKSLAKLRSGVFVHGRWTAEAFVEKVSYERRLDTTKLRMIIHEGRNRQIRLMCESVGHPVEELERVRIGNLTHKGMRRGEARLITVLEREMLWSSSGPRAEAAWLEERLGKKRPAPRNPSPDRGLGERGDRPNRPDGQQDRPRRDYHRREDPRDDRGGSRPTDSGPVGDAPRYSQDSRPPRPRPEGRRPSRPQDGGYEVRDPFAPKPKINTGGRGYMRKPGGPGGNRGRFQGDQKRNSGLSNRPPKPKRKD